MRLNQERTDRIQMAYKASEEFNATLAYVKVNHTFDGVEPCLAT